jgi:hypothetical protein
MAEYRQITAELHFHLFQTSLKKVKQKISDNMKIAFTLALTYISQVAAYNNGIVKIDLNPTRNTYFKREINGKNVQTIFDGDTPFIGTISMGNPAQEMNVLFDTGSSILGILAANNDYCGTSCPDGFFNISESSSGTLTNQTFTLGYLDGSGLEGYIASDTVTIGELSATVRFVYADKIEGNSIGIAGIGYTAGSKNLIDFFVDDSQISRRVFSSYDFLDGNGAIIFGGLDEAKYVGSLTKIPLVNEEQYFHVEVSAISAVCGGITSKTSVFILDTGGDATMVTSELYHAIYQTFHSKKTNGPLDNLLPSYDNDNYVFKCKDALPLIFNFSGKELKIDTANFLLHLFYSTGELLLDDDGHELCTAAIFESEVNSLGSYGLRGAFIVWDIDNAQIALAQAASSTDEVFVEIKDEIPHAVNAPGYSGEEYVFSYVDPETISIPADVVFNFGSSAGDPDECSSSGSSSWNSLESSSATLSSTETSSGEPSRTLSARPSESSSEKSPQETISPSSNLPSELLPAESSTEISSSTETETTSHRSRGTSIETVVSSEKSTTSQLSTSTFTQYVLRTVVHTIFEC